MEPNVHQFYCESAWEYGVKRGAKINKEQSRIAPLLFQMEMVAWSVVKTVSPVDLLALYLN